VSLLNEIENYYNSVDTTFFYGYFLSGYGSGSGYVDLNDEIEEIEDILNVNCHYHNHSLGWKIYLLFNFIVMFIIPFLVSLLQFAEDYIFHYNLNIMRSSHVFRCS